MPISEAAPRFEQVWDAAVPRERGLNLMSMMDAAAQGHFKALWAMGYDVLLTNPDLAATLQSLRNLEFLVVISS